MEIRFARSSVAVVMRYWTVGLESSGMGVVSPCVVGTTSGVVRGGMSVALVEDDGEGFSDCIGN